MVSTLASKVKTASGVIVIQSADATMLLVRLDPSRWQSSKTNQPARNQNGT